VEAGFDGVEIHGAYVFNTAIFFRIQQTNDKWGGTIERE
jgi:2,4-dienoyl-CoA reductase-like NADH-dependent reductase (Old Yellow Enzyme family)